MHKQRLAIAIAIALAAPATVLAQDRDVPMFSFSGFGTIGAVSTDNGLAEYATSSLQGGGAKKKADFGVDSLIAGQVTARPFSSLSFVAQAVASRTADDDFKPHVEWAFARYDITKDLSVRGGIMAIPMFMLSESRLVGLSYPWVRTPTALYSQAPFTNFRGADLTYRHEVAGATLTLQPYIGFARAQIPEAATGGHITSKLDEMRGVNLVAEMGPWTARAGYMTTQFTYSSASINQLFGGLRAVSGLIPAAGPLAASLDSIDKKMSFTAAGLSYESGNILAQAEYAKRKADFFLADTTAWYTTFGYRFGNVMPHVTLSRVRTDSPTSQSVLPTAGPLAAIGAGVNTLLATQNLSQNTVAVGVRYQFAKNADVKLQWDRIDLPTGALGNFRGSVPGFAGSTVNVYSVAVDFVF